MDQFLFSWKFLLSYQCRMGAKGLREVNKEGEMSHLSATEWDSMTKE